MHTRRRWWNRYVPDHISNPFPLAFRLLTSSRREARSALLLAAAGASLAPIDVLLKRVEEREYAQAQPHDQPVLLVCGPPRSGTTLLAQYLINTLEVCYTNNLTSIFPRSPITANRRLGKVAPLRPGDYAAYYGKSRGLSGANDALYIWDRWLGSDRRQVPVSLMPGSASAMPRFFGALQSLYGLPVVNKVNRLNTCASLVAEHLEHSWFFCIHREPLMLAQSLYLARQEISGNMGIAYGVQHPDPHPDPVEDVCRQVIFHEDQARKQQKLLGSGRFSLVSYEDFCARPAAFVSAIRADVAGLSLRATDAHKQVFQVSKKPRLPPGILDRMSRRLDELGAGGLNFRRF